MCLSVERELAQYTGIKRCLGLSSGHRRRASGPAVPGGRARQRNAHRLAFYTLLLAPSAFNPETFTFLCLYQQDEWCELQYSFVETKLEPRTLPQQAGLNLLWVV